MRSGDNKRALGRVAMIDNTVDSATGMVSVRATMPNENEVLWPGTLVNTQLNLRQEQAVVVPSAAMQTGQRGSYLFVIKDGVASVVAVVAILLIWQPSVPAPVIRVRARVLRERALRSAFLRTRDPDADGRVRARAPGQGLAAG